jgi:hypothetical protein
VTLPLFRFHEIELCERKDAMQLVVGGERAPRIRVEPYAAMAPM